jgi:hypothetical protein
MNRRHLLQFATAIMFQSHAIDRVRAATSGAGTRTPEDIATDEDFWSEIRAAFSVDRNVINLNNGYVSPSPRPVQDAMRRYLEYSDMGPYHTMINVLERQVESVRRRLALAAGCDAEEMAITRNASESLENAQYGIDLQRGDEVLTTDQDYPRMLMTFAQRQRREGIVLKTISFPVPPPSMDDLFRRFDQPHRPDLPRAPDLPDGARPQHSRDCRWRSRLQPLPLQNLRSRLRLLRHQPAQVDLRAGRHRFPLHTQEPHREHLEHDGQRPHARQRYS